MKGLSLVPDQYHYIFVVLVVVGCLLLATFFVSLLRLIIARDKFIKFDSLKNGGRGLLGRYPSVLSVKISFKKTELLESEVVLYNKVIKLKKITIIAFISFYVLAALTHMLKNYLTR